MALIQKWLSNVCPRFSSTTNEYWGNNKASWNRNPCRRLQFQSWTSYYERWLRQRLWKCLLLGRAIPGLLGLESWVLTVHPNAARQLPSLGSILQASIRFRCPRLLQRKEEKAWWNNQRVWLIDNSFRKQKSRWKNSQNYFRRQRIHSFHGWKMGIGYLGSVRYLKSLRGRTWPLLFLL